MDDRFRRAMDYVLQDEDVHDESDPIGGDTWYGLARRYHQDMTPWPPTRVQAVERYYHRYWLPYRLDELPSRLAYAVFDGIVQHDRSAVRMLQFCLGVKVDGKLGPRTVAACRVAVVDRLVREFLACRGAYYGHLPNFSDKGRGWMNRLFAVHQRCLAWDVSRRMRHAERGLDSPAPA